MATHVDDKDLSRSMQDLDEDLRHRLLQLLAPSREEDMPDRENELEPDEVGASHAAPNQARANQVGANQVDVSRMRERVQHKLGIQLEGNARRGLHGKRRRELVGVIGGLGVASAIAALTLVSPFSTSSAHNGNLSFIPGLGMVQSSKGGAPVYILKTPVSSTWSGSPIKVTGMMLTSNEIMVSLVGSSQAYPPEGNLPKVVYKTKSGQTIVLTSAGGVGVGATGRHQYQWTQESYAKGRYHFSRPPSGTLLIGTSIPTRIPVRLVLAKSVQNMAQLGPTKTMQGITMTAVATRNGRDAVLTVIPQYQGNFHIWSSVPMSAAGKLGIRISDSLHHHYVPKQLLTFGPNSQISFKPRQGVTRYLITVPSADATYAGTASITLPVPASHSAIVDKTITLAGFPVTFTKVERMDGVSGSARSGSGPSSAGMTLRVYLNMHANVNASKEIHSFQTNFVSNYNIDSKTGVIDWLDIQVQPHQSQVILNLSQPDVYIRGPWTFPITLPAKPQIGQSKSAQTPS